MMNLHSLNWRVASSQVIVYFVEIRDEFLSMVDHRQVQRTQ